MTEIFWTFLITSGVGLVLAVGRIIYKSKCVTIRCGCIEIERDIITEERIDKIQIARNRRNASAATGVESEQDFV